MPPPAAVVTKLESWIPPQIDWREFPNAQLFIVPAQDDDIVEFLIKGCLSIPTAGSQEGASLLSRFSGLNTLKGQLQCYIAEAASPVVSASGKSLPMELVVYCLGAWYLPAENGLAILAGLEQPTAWTIPLGLELTRALNNLYKEHLDLVSDWESQEVANEASHQALIDAHPQHKEALEKGRIFGHLEGRGQKPSVVLDTLVSSFPNAAFIETIESTDAKALQRTAVQAVAASGLLPSRDGQYSGIIACKKSVRRGLVTWAPHLGLPSYPEIRWAVQTVLPRSMAHPRRSHLGGPKIELVSAPADARTSVAMPREIGEWIDILSETRMDDRDFAQRVDQSCKDRSSEGFEAIAWFQPYHEWTEETWGIYLDAERLDDFALSILADCRDRGSPISFGLASILALGLINAHEMFHARVEAAASWLELNVRSPRYRRYEASVYRALAGTSNWLEEALANWSAWRWFNSQQTRALLSALVKNPDELASIIDGVLDLSPPGYRDWRAGHDRETWRVFAAQLTSGRPDPGPKSIALPLESVFLDPLPYDLIASDIPVWLVGHGIIADRLGGHPASFHVPSRREAERVLRYFNHRHVPARGKGSHELWVAPDQRAFSLPTRDPLSRQVFSSLLSHLLIDKKTYVRDIRPKL